MAEGDKIGTTLEICADPECRTHFRKNGTAAVEHRPAGMAAAAAPAPRASKVPDRDQRERQKRADEIERRVRNAILATVGKTLARADVELILSSALHRAWHADLITAARICKLDPKSGQYATALEQYAKRLEDAALNRFLITLMLLQHPQLAASEAKARKIDLKSIEQSLELNVAPRKGTPAAVRNGKQNEKAPAPARPSATGTRKARKAS